MGTIAQELTRIQTAKADIKTAIEAKGVTVPSATTIDGYATLVGQIQTGATEAPENDVNFYDYDGFRVASFTIAEAKALTQAEYNAILPPTHEGLTFQEWNWTLSDITSYNRRYIDIGANYITTDGKTHIVGEVTDATLPVSITLRGGGFVEIDVDWGDNSTHDTFTYDNAESNKVFTHTYSQNGEYVIKVSIVSGSGYLSPYRKKDYAWSSNFVIKEVNLGGGYLSLHGDNALSFIPKTFKLSLASTTYCHFTQVLLNSSPACLIIPRSTTSFVRQGGLQWLNGRISMPKTVPNFTGALFGNSFINSLVFPVDNADASYNQYGLQNCKFLTKLSLPSTFKFSGSLFQTGSMENLVILEIVQGWIPSTDMNLSATNMNKATIVDFFNKLGTTTNTLTLTFGTRLLNLLSATDKAIATDKGYTLA